MAATIWSGWLQRHGRAADEGGMVLDNIVLVVGVLGIATIVRNLIGARSHLRRVARQRSGLHQSSQTTRR